ncbi:ice-structuring glycoprotein-like [Cyclospora cayetanensis]|uniref:Ice-structuring glycoprotein-like n=1 Tax=Cyclospora cayetanensis TaxID=88456 RepID=A0A6P6S0Q1_9EIME|nr:ice-structuring glycoprotein-like [Cyclospora cayetanensis]
MLSPQAVQALQRMRQAPVATVATVARLSIPPAAHLRLELSTPPEESNAQTRTSAAATPPDATKAAAAASQAVASSNAAAKASAAASASEAADASAAAKASAAASASEAADASAFEAVASAAASASVGASAGSSSPPTTFEALHEPLTPACLRCRDGNGSNPHQGGSNRSSSIASDFKPQNCGAREEAAATKAPILVLQNQDTHRQKCSHPPHLAVAAVVAAPAALEIAKTRGAAVATPAELLPAAGVADATAGAATSAARRAAAPAVLLWPRHCCCCCIRSHSTPAFKSRAAPERLEETFESAAPTAVIGAVAVAKYTREDKGATAKQQTGFRQTEGDPSSTFAAACQRTVACCPEAAATPNTHYCAAPSGKIQIAVSLLRGHQHPSPFLNLNLQCRVHAPRIKCHPLRRRKPRQAGLDYSADRANEGPLPDTDHEKCRGAAAAATAAVLRAKLHFGSFHYTNYSLARTDRQMVPWIGCSYLVFARGGSARHYKTQCDERVPVTRPSTGCGCSGPKQLSLDRNITQFYKLVSISRTEEGKSPTVRLHNAFSGGKGGLQAEVNAVWPPAGKTP